MTEKTFSDFYKSIMDLIKSYENNNIMLKVENDLDSNFIRITGEHFDSLSRAKQGFEDISELSYTVAEHHPYWALLYHCTQIGKLTLDKWNDELTKDELDEIEWSLKELKNTYEKLKENLAHD